MHFFPWLQIDLVSETELDTLEKKIKVRSSLATEGSHLLFRID